MFAQQKEQEHQTSAEIILIAHPILAPKKMRRALERVRLLNNRYNKNNEDKPYKLRPHPAKAMVLNNGLILHAIPRELFAVLLGMHHVLSELSYLQPAMV